MNLQDLNAHLESRIAALAAGMVAGYVGAIHYKGETVTQAWGTANLNTGAPMTSDTRWQLGSITKVMTATMIMRLVDQGRVDLDRKVVEYLPEFRLSEDGAAEQILVRHLLDHTNGIDADALVPSQEFGPRMVESYVDALANRGVLFAPGTFTHYTNPGFVLAGRIIERLEGVTFNAALERDLYAPLGMTGSCTSAAQAILGRIAIGAHAGGANGALRATAMFGLPASTAPAGGTPIVTAQDMIAFARLHLDGGKAHDGSNYLSARSVNLMRTVAFDLDTPNCAASGLGWRMIPIAGTTALFHGGGSPGAVSSLLVFPDLDLIIVGFATGPGASLIHDPVAATVLQELLGRDVTAPFEHGPAPSDLTRFEGRYAHFQSTLDVKLVEGKLQAIAGFHPIDDDHARILAAYAGVDPAAQQIPSVILEPINETLFKIAGAPDQMFYGPWGRMALHSFHAPDSAGRFGFHQFRWRAARRA